MSSHASISSGDERIRWKWAECLPWLTAPDGGADGEQLPTVMLVPGIDGAHNWGSQTMIKYLFLGSTTSSMIEPTVRTESEAIEDCVLAIDGTFAGRKIAVYAPASVGAKALETIDRGTSRNKHLLSNAELAASVDDAEMFKALAFVNMAAGQPLIGLPLSGKAQSHMPGSAAAPSDAGHPAHMAAEQWPLVQAYGAADLGTGGFFTMVHKVADATAGVALLLSAVDAHCLRNAATSASVSLLQQWSLTLTLACAGKTPARRASMSELVLGDPLRNFAEFALMQQAPADDVPPEAQDITTGASAAMTGAGFVMGQRTELEDCSAALASPSERPTSTAGGHIDSDTATPALHGIAEAWDPSTGVRASRVVFLTAPRDASGNEATLRACNASLISSHRAALASLERLPSPMLPSAEVLAEKLLKAALRVWRRPAAARSLPAGCAASDLLSLRVEVIDAQGRAVDTAVAGAAAAAADGDVVKLSGLAARRQSLPLRSLVHVRTHLGPIPDGVGGIAVGDTVVVLQDSPLLPRMHGFQPEDDALPATSDDAHSSARSRVTVESLTSGFSHFRVIDCVPGRGAEADSAAAEACAAGKPDTQPEDVDLDDGAAATAASAAGAGEAKLSAPDHTAFVLGNEVSGGSTIRGLQVLLGGSACASESASMAVHENGIIMRCPGRGALALSMERHVADVRVVSGKAAAAACGVQLADSETRRAAVEGWLSADTDTLLALADSIEGASDTSSSSSLMLGMPSPGGKSGGPSVARTEQLTHAPDVLVLALFGEAEAMDVNGGPDCKVDDPATPWALPAPLWSTSRLEQTQSRALGVLLPAGSAARSKVLGFVASWKLTARTASSARHIAVSEARAAAVTETGGAGEAISGVSSSTADALALAGAGGDALPTGLVAPYSQVALSSLRLAWAVLDACEKARLADAAAIDALQSGVPLADDAASHAPRTDGAPAWLEPGVQAPEDTADATAAKRMSVPVLVLCGASGSGRSQVSQALRTATGLTHSWAVAKCEPSWEPLVVNVAVPDSAMTVASAGTSAPTVSTSTGQCLLGDYSASLDLEAVTALLTAAVEHAIEGAKGTDKQPAVVFVPPPSASARVSCAAVAAASQNSCNVVISGCASTVHARSAFADSRATQPLPGVIGATEPGFVSHILVTGQDDSPQAARVLRASLQKANPTSSVVPVRGGVGRPVVVPVETLRSLASGRSFSCRAAVAARATLCPSWWRGLTHSTVRGDRPQAPEHGGPAVLRVPALCTLVESRLRAVMSRHVTRLPDPVAEALKGTASSKAAHSEDSAPAGRAIYAHAWRAQGVVRLVKHDSVGSVSRVLERAEADDRLDSTTTVRDASSRTQGSDLQTVRVLSASSFCTVDAVPDAPTQVHRPNAKMGAVGLTSPSCGFVDFHGLGPGLLLAACTIAQNVDACRPCLPADERAKDKASLTEQQRHAIREANLHAPLPDEFQFDGTGYSSLSGLSQVFHPHMEQFESAFLAEVNEKITEFNVTAAAVADRADAEAAGARHIWANRAVSTESTAALADQWWSNFPEQLPPLHTMARGYYDGADAEASIARPVRTTIDQAEPASAAAVSSPEARAVMSSGSVQARREARQLHEEAQAAKTSQWSGSGWDGLAHASTHAAVSTPAAAAAVVTAPVAAPVATPVATPVAAPVATPVATRAVPETAAIGGAELHDIVGPHGGERESKESDD